MPRTSAAAVDGVHDTGVLGRISPPEGAKAEMIRRHLPLVISVARRHAWWGADLSELISEGNAALVRAANRFDPAREVAFVSYALPWIRHAVRSACVRSREVIALPRPIRRLTAAYRRLTSSAPGVMMSAQEVAGRLGVSRDTAALVIEASTRRRLTPGGQEPSPRHDVLETITCDAQEDPSSHLEADDEISQTRAALAELSPADRELVTLHFGLGGDRPLSAEAIARRLSLPLVRVAANLRRTVERLHSVLGARSVA